MKPNSGDGRRGATIGLKLLAAAALLVLPGVPASADEGTFDCTKFVPAGACPETDECTGSTSVYYSNCTIRCIDAQGETSGTAKCKKADPEG